MKKVVFERHKKSISVGLVVIISLMILLSVFSFVVYQHDLQGLMEKKTQQDMERSTHQSVLLFNSMIDDYFKQLGLFGTFCSLNTGEYNDEILSALREHNIGNEYSNMAVCTPEGMMYTGVETPSDVSQNSVFQQAMAGEKVVSEVLTASDGRDRIVLAQPIRSDGQITGVVMAEYDVQMFTELLGGSQFEGMGATLIMQRDGRMVSSYAGMENFDTFYDALQPMDFRGTDTLESFEHRAQNGESGFFTYYRDGHARYLYFEPAGINDWVVMSLVLAESMDEQLNAISENSFELMAANTAFYGAIILCIVFLVRNTRKILRDNQKDALTDLYHKVSARAMAEKEIRNARGGAMFACMFMDVDGFKHVNDELGHKAGDQLLVKFAGELVRMFGDESIISRFGGDEFMVFRLGIRSRSQVEKEAVHLLEITRNKKEYASTISMGIAFYPQDGADYETLLRHADQALYEAKRRGKNQYAVYEKKEKDTE